MMSARREYGGLDRARCVAAALVVAIHTYPLLGMNEGADFFLTRVLARVAVPFFLMVTGQFVVARVWHGGESARRYLMKYVRKMSLLYGCFIVLYLPVGIYAGHYKGMTPMGWLRAILFDGTFYHLWYFPACIMGVLLVYGLRKILSARQVLAVSAVLYVFGLLGDGYYGIAAAVPILDKIYEGIFVISSHTRNGVFMAPIFLTLGAMLGAKADKDRKAGKTGRKTGRRGKERTILLAFMLISVFILMTMEAFLLRQFEMQRHDSMYLLLVPVMVLLYQLLLRWEARPWPALRDVALWIYVIHPGIIVVVRGAAKVLNQTKILVDDNLVHYLVVLLLSFAVSVAAAVLVPIVKDFTVGFLAGLREDGTRRMRGKTDLEARKRT